jgi:hypothetical protein
MPKMNCQQKRQQRVLTESFASRLELSGGGVVSRESGDFSCRAVLADFGSGR